MTIDYMRMFDIARASQESGGRGDAKAILLEGDPGNHKTTMIREWVEGINYTYFPMLLGQVDPMDLSDLWVPNFETGKLQRMSTDIFCNPTLDEGTDGIVIHFDELRDAQPETKAIIKTLISDRMHNGRPIAGNVIFIASSNFADSGCGGTELTQSEMARFIALECPSDPVGWLEYAERVGINFDIRLFIHQFKHFLCSEFDPNSSEFGQPSMRSWSQLSFALDQTTKDEVELRALLAQKYVGKGVGHEFTAFTMLEEALPTDEEIIDDPEGATMPANVSTQYAIIGLMAAWAKRRRLAGVHVEPHESTAIVTYFRRMPEALSVFGIRMITMEHEDVAACKAYSKFKQEVASYENLS